MSLAEHVPWIIITYLQVGFFWGLTAFYVQRRRYGYTWPTWLSAAVNFAIWPLGMLCAFRCLIARR